MQLRKYGPMLLDFEDGPGLDDSKKHEGAFHLSESGTSSEYTRESVCLDSENSSISRSTGSSSTLIVSL